MTAWASSEEESRIMRKLRAVFIIARKSVCKVKPAHRDQQGTGAFYKVIDRDDTERFLFMTCNHVLPTNSLNEISQAILEIEDIQQLKNFSFNKRDVKYIWTSEVFDATIVEISSEVARSLKSAEVIFLKVGQIISNTEVAILHYQKGGFGIAHGDIDHKNGNDVFYQIGNAPGSSGSPLLNWGCMALAMHKAGKQETELWRKASALTAIVNAYLEDYPNDTLQCVLNIRVRVFGYTGCSLRGIKMFSVDYT